MGGTAGRKLIEPQDLMHRDVIADPHHNLTILGMGPIDEREFSSWQMGFAAAHAGHR